MQPVYYALLMHSKCRESDALAFPFLFTMTNALYALHACHRSYHLFHLNPATVNDNSFHVRQRFQSAWWRLMNLLISTL